MNQDLKLRAVEYTDLDVIKKWENDMSAWDYSDNIAPLSTRIVEEYIAGYTADPFGRGELRLVLTDDSDTAIGLMDLYNISALHAHAFIGIYIGEENRRKGYGLRGLGLLCEYARRHLGLNTLAALVIEGNNASVNLFSTYGFSHSGTMPSWRRIGLDRRDVKIFTLTL